MHNLKKQITDLTESGKQILKSAADNTGQIEVYSDAMQGITEALKAGVSTELKSELKELAAVHSQLIAKVEAHKQRIRSELMSLKKKGKIVIRYTDQMPKSISLKTRRKV